MTKKTFMRKYGRAGAALWARRGSGMPWTRAAVNIRQRCENPRASKYQYYGGAGIKCRISSAELKAAYYRDHAWEMVCPSVDRIDSNGDYTPANTRWIEFSENRARRDGPHYLRATDIHVKPA